MGVRAVFGLVLAAHAARVWATCAYGTGLHPRAEDGRVEVGRFGYIGEKGPANWISLDPIANALCAGGTRQSPIDIKPQSLKAVRAAELSLAVADMPSGAAFENLGTTVEVVAAPGVGSMTFGNASYSLRQFHFHLPSEHLDDGTSMAMEMHMVWQGNASQVAVVAVFIDVDGAQAAASRPRRSSIETRAAGQGPAGGRRRTPAGRPRGASIVPPIDSAAVAPSTLLDTVFSSVEDIATPGTATQTPPLVMSELVDTLHSGSFYTYTGSLTTPPCSEGVRWLVSSQKLAIHMSTFARARSVIGFNARFPQNVPGGSNVLAMSST